MNEEDKTKQPIENTDQAMIDVELAEYIASITEHTKQTERAKDILPYALGFRAAAIAFVDSIQEVIASEEDERPQAIDDCVLAVKSVKANYRLLDIAITGA